MAYLLGQIIGYSLIPGILGGLGYSAALNGKGSAIVFMIVMIVFTVLAVRGSFLNNNFGIAQIVGSALTIVFTVLILQEKNKHK